MVLAETGDAREFSQGLRLRDVRLQLTEQPRNSPRIRRSFWRIAAEITRYPDDGAGQFQRDLLDGVLPCYRRRGARGQRRQRAKRRQAIAIEIDTRRSRVMRSNNSGSN